MLEQLVDGWLTGDNMKLQLTKVFHQVPFIFVPVDGSTPPNANGPAFSHEESSVISPFVALLLFSHFLFPLIPSETCGIYTLFQLLSSFSYFFILENICLDSQLFVLLFIYVIVPLSE